MKLDSFYEALRRNLTRLQPEFNDSDWDRFQEAGYLPPVPFWKAGWVRALAALVVLGGLMALVYVVYVSPQKQLEQRVQFLTQQRDSLLSRQVPRPATSPDSSWNDSVATGSVPAPNSGTEAVPDSAASRISAPAPGTQSFDDWFNSVLEKNPLPTVAPEPEAVRSVRPQKAPVRVRKAAAKRRPKTVAPERQIARAKRVPVPAPPSPALTDSTESVPGAELTVERTQTLELNLLPTPPIRLMTVTPPTLPEISYESARQQLDSSAPASSVPGP